MEPKRITPAELGIPEAIPLPKRKDWRIGIVGFGHIAQGAHAPAYRRAGWTIAGIADPNPEARLVASERFGVERTYRTYSELLASPEIEVVDLCTQPTVREEVVVAVTEAGKHIIVEKPLAQTIDECTRMIEAAERADIKLAVHQNYRWFKMCFAAQQIVERGLIGEPFFVSIELFGRQDVGLVDHVFYRECDNFLTVQWDNHLADLLRYWTGQDARRVLARTGRMKGQNFRSDNLLMVIADFGQGLTGHILHHELLRSSMESCRCRIDGDQGSLVFDFHGYLHLESSRLGEGIYALDTPPSDYVSSFVGSMGDLLIAVEDDREPLVSGRRNLTTIRTILAGDESAKAGGKWIPSL